MKTEDVCGIILAGGESKRMGMDKTLLQYKGQSLVQRMVQTISPFCGHILISSNNSSHESAGLEIVADEIPTRGPIGGIYSCLKKSDCPFNLIVPADVTLISAELIQYLTENSHPDKISAIVTPSGFIEPLCAIYPKTILPALEDFIKSGNNKLIDFLIEQDFHPVRLFEDQPFYHPNLLLNVNTPEELKELLRK